MANMKIISGDIRQVGITGHNFSLNFEDFAALNSGIIQITNPLSSTECLITKAEFKDFVNLVRDLTGWEI